MTTPFIDFFDDYEMESTIQLKKILRIGADEQNEDEDSRPTSSNMIVTSYNSSKLKYKEYRSPSPSSSSVSSSSTCTSDLSSLASSSTGSCFFGPRQRIPVFRHRRCYSFELSCTSSSYSNDNYGHRTFYDDCEIERTQEWRQHSSFSSSSSDEVFYYNNRSSLFGLKSRYFDAPSPSALPKPPAHWLTDRALRNADNSIQTGVDLFSTECFKQQYGNLDNHPREKNLLEMLKRSSAMLGLDSTGVDHHCDLVSQNLKMLLKVQSAPVDYMIYDN